MNKPNKNQKAGKWSKNDVLCLMIVVCTCVLVFGMLALTVTPSQYNIQVGDPAPTIIKATKDVWDEISYEKAQDEKEKEVKKTSFIEDVPSRAAQEENDLKNAKDALDTLIDLSLRLRPAPAAVPEQVVYENEGSELPAQDEILPGETEKDSTEDGQPEQEKIQEDGESPMPVEIVLDENKLGEVNEELSSLGVVLTMEQMRALSETDVEELRRLSETLKTKIAEKQLTDIEESALPEVKTEILSALDSENTEILAVFEQIIDKNVRHNVFFNQKKYDEARKEKREEVDHDKYKIGTGIAIVEDGKPITEEQYAMLKSSGLIKDGQIDIWLYIGIGILIVIMVVMIILYLYLYEPQISKNPKQLLIIALACVIELMLGILTRLIELKVGQNQVYIMPTVLGILLITLLIRSRVALFINLPLSVMASMISGSSSSFSDVSTYTMVISSFVAGCVALRVIKKRQTRLNVLIAGFAAGLAYVISTFSLLLLSSSNVTDSLYISLFSGLGGPLSAIICIALMPAFEAVFNVITNTRLVEMSNPNQPLLRRLLLEAPGTYHHSIIVANLAEAAAAEIGANSLLARVGSYYHDIGKIMRPQYFTENQMGDNPHDRTDPRVSTAIITAHTKDGAQLMKEYRVPEEIRNIALTHHGDTPVIYFYNKTLEENGEARLEDYRYPGPRPHTREEAIVMMADSVEAATRSIQNPDRERVREVVDKLISQKIDDGQLDDCELSLKDISLIENAFVTVLSGAFHERIEYPNVEIPKKHGEDESEKPASAN